MSCFVIGFICFFAGLFVGFLTFALITIAGYEDRCSNCPLNIEEKEDNK